MDTSIPRSFKFPLWCQRWIHLWTQDLEHPSRCAMPLLLIPSSCRAMMRARRVSWVSWWFMTMESAVQEWSSQHHWPPTSPSVLGDWLSSHTHKMWLALTDRTPHWQTPHLGLPLLLVPLLISFYILSTNIERYNTYGSQNIRERLVSSISSEREISLFPPGPMMLVYDRCPVYMVRVVQPWLRQVLKFTGPGLA